MGNWSSCSDAILMNYCLSLIPGAITFGLITGLVGALLNRAVNGGGKSA